MIQYSVMFCKILLLIDLKMYYLKILLAFCNSFSISVARVTRGPRTAYSNFTRLGFKFSRVMTLEAMVRWKRAMLLGLRATNANSSAIDRTALPLHTRLAPAMIFTGDMFSAAAINDATLNTSLSPQHSVRPATPLIIYEEIYKMVRSSRN